MITIPLENKVFSAACGRSRDDAIKMMQKALGLDANSPVLDRMPSGAEWNRMQTSLRLQKMGEWLKAECFQLADINDNPANWVSAIDPIHSVGTRD